MKFKVLIHKKTKQFGSIIDEFGQIIESDTPTLFHLDFDIALNFGSEQNFNEYSIEIYELIKAM